ncbi:hypothetical protein SPRG_19294 [Saprolegnia parasitica CBS 223.65]|uniref:Peptidase S74 domain-containing protein n=1 Tax=Saprolegnia parasitica (strain CBS 223.65) TaxID=695850 RepID=A0A067D3W4_SAPPC|nr:hypothetical protein SPRG_19294 [Saprolegnia parasitica CBS 223.65]KDO33682.1 hypothetical protein SPRG_19294 [Saprolegnia parasitica CBS 223.65]|eukprot:XP_012195709.1 hypothetical protein SPRG_19294 [Saprolegnia parasitica CBS 223.65]
MTQRSDARLKRVLRPASVSSVIFHALRPIEFEWINATRAPPGLQAGFLAQEVATWLPHLVSADSNGMLSMNYIGLIPYVVSHVQELDMQLQACESRLSDQSTSLQEQLKMATAANAELLQRLSVLEQQVAADAAQMHQRLASLETAVAGLEGSTKTALAV